MNMDSVPVAEEITSPAPAKELCVLVVDDSATIRRSAETMLANEGCRVVTAENGSIGYELFQEAEQRSEYFDAVITDMQMPLMTGYELAAAIRPSSSVPIIALTAFTQEEDEDKCLQAGCSAYLTKPIDTNTFAAQVAELIRNI